jgi:UDP-2-acetamido-3-amino-2,3-dideoxy-glucuronate N-acetyltransferase
VTASGEGSSTHETAVVEDNVRVGRGSRICSRAHVRRGAVIGDGSTIGSNAFVDEGVRIGSRVEIQTNVSVYRGVTIEDDVLVGTSAEFTNDLYPRAVSDSWQIVPTVIHRGATIGANATIVCGNDIGSWATVGAGAVVAEPVLEHELVVGNPASRLGWVCACGRVVAHTPERPDQLRCAECRREGERSSR